jgi:hypothetical protein
VSFVNGVSTILGGKHVDYVLNQITKASDLINKRNKDANVKPQHVKDKLFLTKRYDPEPRLQRPDEGDSGHAGDEVEEDRSFGQVRGRLVKNTTSPSWPVHPTESSEKTDGAKKNIVRVPWTTQERRNRSSVLSSDGR